MLHFLLDSFILCFACINVRVAHVCFAPRDPLELELWMAVTTGVFRIQVLCKNNSALNCVFVIIIFFLDHITHPVGSSSVDVASRTSYGA